MNSPLPLSPLNLPLLRSDPANIFQSFILDELQEKQALQQIQPIFLAYVQNKLAAYAASYVQNSLEFSSDPQKQMIALVNHAAIQAKCLVLQELMAEIIDAQTLEEPKQQQEEEG